MAFAPNQASLGVDLSTLLARIVYLSPRFAAEIAFYSEHAMVAPFDAFLAP